MFLDINSEMKLTPENEIVESVLYKIYGGFDGLEDLLIKFNDKYNPAKWKFSHTDFEDFYNGKNIELSFFENEIYVKAENHTIVFNDFYEENFLFNYEPTAYDSFNDKRNILHNVLSIINKFCFEDEFSENQKSIIINNIVSRISHEIDKSEKCTKKENEILFDKLIYISNGYKATYDKIYELFGTYINIEKKEFTNLEAIKNFSKKATKKSPNWHLVFNDILNGKIVLIGEYNPQCFYENIPFDNPTQLGDYLDKLYNKEKSRLRSILTETMANSNTSKNIFHKNKKKKLKEMIDKSTVNEICDYFKNKYNMLFSTDLKKT